MIEQWLNGIGDLATTQVNVLGMFVLTLFVFSLVALVIAWKRPTVKEPKDETSENDVLRLLIEQFGSISTELRGFAEAVKADSAETTIEHAEMVTTLKTMNTLLIDVSNGNDKMIKSVDKLTQNVGTYTDKVKEAGTNIMSTITPLDQILQEIRDELQQLRQSVDNHLDESNKFRDNVTEKTTEIESRLLQVETRVTQETPKVEPEKKPIETPIEENKTNAESTDTIG